MLEFQEEILNRELDRLPRQSRVAFAASCTQRLARVCTIVMANNGSTDNANAFDQAMTYIWTHILATHENATTGQMLSMIMELIPDDDSPAWTPLAAVSALVSTLNSCSASGKG